MNQGIGVIRVNQVIRVRRARSRSGGSVGLGGGRWATTTQTRGAPGPRAPRIAGSTGVTGGSLYKVCWKDGREDGPVILAPGRPGKRNPPGAGIRNRPQRTDADRRTEQDVEITQGGGF